MKLLITGKDGQVGSELFKILKIKNFNSFFFNKEELDISNYNQILIKIKLVQPNIIINLAAYTDVKKAEKNLKECLRINRDGVLNLVKICERESILLIHISTDYVFDGKKKGKYNELDEVNPLNNYGFSKLEGEKMIIENLRKYIIIRTSWIFSSFGENFVKKIISSLQKKTILSVTANQIGGPTYAKNLAHIIILFCKKFIKNNTLDYGIFHYSNGPNVTWYDFSNEIVKNLTLNKYLLLNNDFKIIKDIEKNSKDIKRPNNSKLSNVKINKYLKISNKTWSDGLDECLTNLKKDQFYEN